MFPNSCQAVLMTEDEALLEYGVASISVKEKYVDFTNSFVPIIKIGARVKVVCTEKGQSTHMFSGEVFLSSKSLLRIISVKCELLPHAEKVLSIDTMFNAKIALPVVKNRVFPMNHITKWIGCQVCGISATELTFTSELLDIELNTAFVIKIKAPVFDKGTEITIRANEGSLLFGKSSRYACKIVSISDLAVVKLIEYIREVNLEIISEFIQDSDNGEIMADGGNKEEAPPESEESDA